MIFSTLIFFSGAFHEKLLSKIGYQPSLNTNQKTSINPFKKQFTIASLGIYLLIQILLPLRHHLYRGNVLWTEEAYRLSWRVMAVEKSGVATFTVQDSKTGRKTEVTNSQYLTKFQEKQMSIQPDFILQYAHFLAKEYEEKYNLEDPIVKVNSYVALNGRTGQQYINPEVNLTKVNWNLKKRSWILPLKD